MTDDLPNRLRLMFSRGVVRHADVQAGLMATQAEFFKGEVRRTELPQGYGLATRPKSGSEVFAIFANGERSAGVALAHDDRRFRPTDLEPGEVVLYGEHARDAIGHWLKLTDDPKPNTVRVKARRIELRAGDHYFIVDADDGISSG
jgi:phage baseplate assembly protein V